MQLSPDRVRRTEIEKLAEDHQTPRSAPPERTAATRSQIRSLATLPSLPRSSQELLQLLLDPELDMLRLAELVEQTPALAARMLGVANSAFFSPLLPVKHVPDAIIRVLGLDLVRDLSVSFVLNQPFELKACRRFDPVRFWVGSMEAAVLAQLLATRLPLRHPPTASTAYLAGLLRDLGLLALVHVAPEAMDAVFGQLSRQPSAGLSTVEQQVLGLDHAEAGAELARAWRLPAPLAAAMGPLDQACGDTQLTTLVSLVLLCRRIIAAFPDSEEIEHDPELSRILTGLGVRFDAWPALLSQWRECTIDIERLAAAFAGAGR